MGPILVSDNISPLGLTTTAPFEMHLPAKGMSGVTAISLTYIFSTIQSSAESRPSFTKIICTNGFSYGLIPPAHTKNVWTLFRQATLILSSLTGHPSESTNNFVNDYFQFLLNAAPLSCFGHSGF